MTGPAAGATVRRESHLGRREVVVGRRLPSRTRLLGASPLVMRVFAMSWGLHGAAHLGGASDSFTKAADGESVDYLAGAWTQSDPTLLRALGVVWALVCAAHLDRPDGAVTSTGRDGGATASPATCRSAPTCTPNAPSTGRRFQAVSRPVGSTARRAGRRSSGARSQPSSRSIRPHPTTTGNSHAHATHTRPNLVIVSAGLSGPAAERTAPHRWRPVDDCAASPEARGRRSKDGRR